MISLAVINIPDGILYGSFSLFTGIFITIVWSIIKLWFSHNTLLREFKEHEKEYRDDRKEDRLEREKDRIVTAELSNGVSLLSGNLQMILGKK